MVATRNGGPARTNQAQPRLFKPIQDPPSGAIKTDIFYRNIQLVKIANSLLQAI
jgi:hypothetical protein